MALRTHPSEVAAELAQLADMSTQAPWVPTRWPTLSNYLTYWHAEVVVPSRRPTTVAKYRTPIMRLDPPGAGQRRWSIRWKPELNALDIAFDGRLLAGRK